MDPGLYVVSTVGANVIGNVVDSRDPHHHGVADGEAAWPADSLVWAIPGSGCHLKANGRHRRSWAAKARLPADLPEAVPGDTVT